MLERETETIIHTLTEQTIGSARSLALKDALATSMPKSIKLYLQCEVAEVMMEDLRGASHFSRLPFTTPIVHQLTKAYTHALALEYILTREEFITMLENGVHFVENYLCRPQWTLEHFVFEKGQRLTLSDVQRKLGYLCEYVYLGKLAEAFMRQNGWQEVGIDDFRSLIAKIDDRIVRQHSPGELARLARPIFEFILLQPEVRNKAIPIKPLIMFFEDKKMKTEVEFIEHLCHIRSTDQLTIEQLAVIFEDLHGDTPAPTQSAQHTETAAAPAGEGTLDSLTAAEAATAPQATPNLDARAPEPPRENVAALAGDRRNIALSLTYSGMTENIAPSPSSPPQDLKKTIPPEQRERFIRTLFQKDESYYNVVVETLNDMKTWRDASLYLQTFFRTSGIDPHLPDVIEFTDIIQLRYLLQQQP